MTWSRVGRVSQVGRVGRHVEREGIDWRLIISARRWFPSFCVLLTTIAASAQQPAVGMVESPNVTVLTGLTVPQFELEMQLMTTALGVGCGYCHVRGSFASENNAHKAPARKMLAMTRAINQQFFPDYRPSSDEESRLGKVTCFTCHQGNEKPRTP
jgi:hypothetical protein